jgi:hypothetical protein
MTAGSTHSGGAGSPPNPQRHLERALPAFWYLSDETFGRERERVLYREWFCAGRTHELQRPGSLQAVDVAGESVLLVRTKAGGAAGPLQRLPPPRLPGQPGPQGRVAALPLPLLDLPAGG